MSIKNIACYILIVCMHQSFAQTKDQYTIEFRPVFNNSDLIMTNTYYKLNTNDSVRFETLKFYISGVELLNNDQLQWKETSSYHLLDASDKKTMTIFLSSKNIDFNQIKFNLGIDSITNVGGVMSGDLDPTQGMYWTWQSGYINFKLEGRYNQCKNRNNEFQFHLGGYQFPFNALQTIILDGSPKEKTEIIFDIEKLFAALDLSKSNQLMSPGEDAVVLSQKISKCFITRQP